MKNILREYIKYQLNARRRHGIHSPFMYDFGDNCLKTAVSKKDYRVFKELKSSFLENKTQIQIKKCKTPSKNTNSFFSVQQITKMIGPSNKVGKLFHRITAHYPMNNVLELGTGNGLGTLMLSSGNDKVNITTVEANTDLYFFAKSHFPALRKDQVMFINDSWFHFIANQKSSTRFDFIVINGNPWDVKNIKKIIPQLQKLIHDETIILLKGIRRTNELYEVWDTLIHTSNYHLSIDLFQVGLLLQRNHQQKEHFVIRY